MEKKTEEVFWAELEEELSWRQKEIRSLCNLASMSPTEDAAHTLNRSLIVMLYAHLEGFVRFALSVYVRSINDAKLRRRQVSFAIAAASLKDVFSALKNPQKKCPWFKRELPSDEKLHRSHREMEFLEQLVNIEAEVANIADSALDFESNLTPVVLRKNLYLLGLTHERFADLDGELHRLLKWRNDIAHGSNGTIIDAKKVEEARSAVFKVMRTVRSDIMSAISSREFVRSDSAPFFWTVR